MRIFFSLIALLALLGAAAGATSKSGAGASAAMPACAASDPIVWINSKSNVYHPKGDKYFGTTKQGKYACTSAALKTGARAAKASLGKGSAASSADATAAPPMDGKKHAKRHTGAAPEPSPT